MIDIENEIFTDIATMLRNQYGAENIYVTGEYVRMPPKFPCVSVIEIDNETYRRTRDSSNNERHAVVFYEVNVYSNKDSGKKAECKRIVNEIDNELMKYGFLRTMTNSIQNEDPTIYRIVARYRAIVGADHKIYRG